MAAALVLRSKKTQKTYRVVHVDREKGVITLKGKQYEFTEKYDPAFFKRQGYELVKEEIDD